MSYMSWINVRICGQWDHPKLIPDLTIDGVNHWGNKQRNQVYVFCTYAVSLVPVVSNLWPNTLGPNTSADPCLAQGRHSKESICLFHAHLMGQLPDHCNCESQDWNSYKETKETHGESYEGSIEDMWDGSTTRSDADFWWSRNFEVENVVR